jgi:hypothetical protein
LAALGGGAGGSVLHGFKRGFFELSGPGFGKNYNHKKTGC